MNKSEQISSERIKKVIRKINKKIRTYDDNPAGDIFFSWHRWRKTLKTELARRWYR